MPPDFLGIGAQKSGTGWLWHNLRLHPNIYVPPLKELHYFDRSKDYPSPSPPSLDVIDKIKKRVRYAIDLTTGRMNNRKRWNFKRATGRHNDQWYESLFSYTGEGMKCGEVTPGYSILKIEDIKKVYNLNPNIKLIYIMRNPIDRAWSQFRMKKKRLVEACTYQDIIKHINSQGVVLRGDYIRTINNWQSVFPPEQLFIDFFDEIINGPKGLMQRIFNFLEVSCNEEITRRIKTERIHASIMQRNMPYEIRKYLNKKYYNIIKELSDRFSSYASIWLRSIEPTTQKK